jgi:hypothetical protein
MPEPKWWEPTPAGDGGPPSFLASPMVLGGMLFGLMFWAVVSLLIALLL